MVKIAPRALKIGVQSRFYPISTVGFRTFFPENFGQAYCACARSIYIFFGLLNAGILETADNQVYINSVIRYQSYGMWKSTP